MNTFTYPSKRSPITRALWEQDNDEARKVLCQIRDQALSLYPFPPGCGVDDRYAMAFGLIAGFATQALTAVHDGRPLKLLGEEIKFGEGL